MTSPTISVVIPAHCAESFLAESITSVLDQERRPLEVIVVDDGSTDATAEVIESFGDRVRPLTHAANQGEAAARNSGLAAARGQAVAMHDADDIMRPQRLRRQAEVLVGAPTAGCVLGRQAVFTEDGTPVPSWLRDGEGTPAAYGSSLVLAWRSTYDAVGGYDESFAHGTDSDWLVRVRAAGLEVVLMDEVLTDRRVHGANATASREGPTGIEFARSLRKVLRDRRQGEG